MEQHLFGKNNENPNIINRFMVDKTLNCNNQKVLDMKTRTHKNTNGCDFQLSENRLVAAEQYFRFHLPCANLP